MIEFVAVPDHLLVPLLETAGTTLRALPPEEVPLAARSLLAFDRRGLARGPARLQLRRALEAEAGFREQVVAAFCARSDVTELLDDWSAERALAIANTAALRDGLAVLACALIAAEPAGADFGLGVVIAVDEAHRRVHDEAAEAVDIATRVVDLEERVRRGESAHELLAEERDRVAEQLRAERRTRRERDDGVAREAARAQERLAELEAEVERERARVAQAEAASARVSDRERARAARSEVASARATERADALEAELQQLRNAAAVAAALAAQVADTPSARTIPSRRATGRRARPNLPGGLLLDSAKGADAMLRSGPVLLVVDGYNVSKAGWPNVSLEIERDSLVSSLNSLHLTSGVDVVAVFDGDGTQSISGTRRTGVRVLFSKAGEEADAVVVELVSQTPLETPVVVASSDRWVREHAETFGAVVISAATLVAVLRRAPGRPAP